MSIYATVSGRIVYPNEQALDQAKAKLTSWNILHGDKLIDEEGNETGEIVGLTISIPCFFNKHLNLEDLIEGSSESKAAEVSVDAMECSVLDNGVFTNYDFLVWARENMPNDSEPEKESDEWYNWLSMAEDKFLTTNFP